MNTDQFVIEKLQKLRTLKATSQWSQSLRTRVMHEARVFSADNVRSKRIHVSDIKSYFLQMPLKFAMSGVFTFIFMIAYFSHENISAGGRLLFAQYSIEQGITAYDRSQSSLAYMQSQVNRFALSDDEALQLEYLQSAIDMNRKELDNLKLMGDPGNYTRDQCLSLYMFYGKYLQTAQSLVSNKLRNSMHNQSSRKSLEKMKIIIEAAYEEMELRVDAYPQV